MDNFAKDIRFAIRTFFRNPLTTVLMVVALAVGIGANSAIFSMVNSIMLTPFPFDHPERIMRIAETHDERGLGDAMTSGPNFLDWQEQSTACEAMALVTMNYFNLTGNSQPVRVASYVASPSLFEVMGAQMALGRRFVEDDTLPGNNRVVILSYGLWQERFGGDPSILNQPIHLDGLPYVVVGVQPEALDFLEAEAPIMIPLPKERAKQGRDNRVYTCLALTREGVTAEEAQAEMDVVADNLRQPYPASNQHWGIAVEPAIEKMVRMMGQTLAVLHGAVGFVLLIACSIVASLLLARAGSRQQEMAIRSAMGAGRGRIIRQLLTESVLLSLLGGVVGLFVTLLGFELIQSLLPPMFTSFLLRQGLDGNVLGFTLVVSVITGVLFGLAPALKISRVDLNSTIKEGGRSAGSRSGSHRTLRFLVATEIALSLILLIGAGLMINSFIRLRSVSPGFDSDRLLTLNVSLPDSKYGEEQQQRAFYQEALQRIERLPGVLSVGAPSVLPLTWGSGVAIEVEGQVRSVDGEADRAEVRHVNSDYFENLKIPLQKGRFFEAPDEGESGNSIIIDDFFGRRFWPDQDPIGKFVKVPEWSGPAYEVVGGVNNVKHSGLRSDPQPTLYIPFLHHPARSIAFAIRTANARNGLAQNVRQAIWAIDPDLPIENVRAMDEVIQDSMLFERFSVVLLTIFSFVALILSAIEIYGIMAYSVSQRRVEIGIRMALGAQIRDVIRMIVGQGMTLTLIGVAVGLVGSVALMRVISSMLYGISATDSTTFLCVSCFLIGVSFLACYIPARKAAVGDPMKSLRYE